MLKMVLSPLPRRKTTTHEKKRHGQHHKQSKHYANTYWPYLPMLVVAVAGLLLNATWNVGNNVLGYATSMSASALLQETNSQRSGSGKASLSLNSKLSQAAQAKANDMVQRDYWAHVSPDGKQPWTFISGVGYAYTAAGENLAYGFDTSAAAVSGWMNSPSHKANLLNGMFKEVGFGIANGADYQGNGEQTVVVALYATPQAIAAAPQATQPTPAPATKPAAEQTPASTPAKPATPAQPKETAPAPVETPVETAIVTEANSETPDTQPLSAKEVSRIDVLTNGNAQWAALVVSVLATVALMALLFSHVKWWRKRLLRGERFIIKHPFFDAAVLAVGVLGFVLTRTSGFIH
jgi:uncharacterized protein YkwD